MRIEDLKNYTYNKEYDSFCYQNCIKVILAYYGVKKPNLLINMTLSFRLQETDDGIAVFDDDARSVLPQYKSAVQRFYYPEDNARDEVWKNNHELISRGVPIIVGVDSFYLEYLPYYKKSHGRHTIVIDGFDEDSRMVHVVDWFAPWFFVGEIPLEQLLEARDSSNEYDGGLYSGKPIYNNWAKVENDKLEGNTLWLIYTQLKMSYEQYFVEDCVDGSYNGIFATTQLKEILRRRDREANEEGNIKFLKKLHDQLYKINRRRNFFTLLLKEAYKETGLEKLKQLEMKTNEFYEIWEKFIYKTVKAYMRYREDTVSRLLISLDEIIAFELQYKENLSSVLQDEYFDYI